MTTTDIVADSGFYNQEVKSNAQKVISMADFKGKVLLIVNTASRCGFTPQYKELEALYQRFKDKGLEILAFPCNQFGGQEPGNDGEIKEFCDLNYQITFPIFAKVDVNGSEAHPLFKHLKLAAPGVLGTEAIKWNFTKFLVNRDGEVVGRFAPKESPMNLIEKIEALL